MARKPASQDEFVMEKKLGSGFFGQVWKAKEKDGEKRTLAVKMVRLQLINENNLMPQLRREIDILYSLQHERIIKLYSDFSDERSMYLCMEFADGSSLFDKLRQHPNGFPAALAARYFYETCEALDYIHHLPEKVIHRDIKPENIMLDAGDHIKLADFGWATMIQQDVEKTTTFCGTLDYLSPEMILNQGHDESADMWGMGVLLYELCTGTSPFGSSSTNSKESKETTCRLILAVDSSLRFPVEMDTNAQDLVGRLCKKKSADRLKVKSAMSHVFCTSHLGTKVDGAASDSTSGFDARPSLVIRKEQKDCERMKAEIQEIYSQVENTKKSVADLKEEIKSCEAEIKKEEQERAKAETACKELQKKIDQTDKELAAAQQQVKRLKGGGYFAGLLKK